MESPALPAISEPLKDNSARANRIQIFFWIYIIITVACVLSEYFQYNLLLGVRDGGYIEDSTAMWNDLRQGVLALLQIGFFIATIIVFLSWFRRAYGNLHRMGINYLRHKESMAIWSFVIPIVSLWWPVQIMNEIWSETQEKIKQADPSYLIKHGEMLIGGWWTLYIVTGIIDRYVFRMSMGEDSLEELLRISQATMVLDFLQLIEALVVIYLVSKISTMEKKMAELYRSNTN